MHKEDGAHSFHSTRLPPTTLDFTQHWVLVPIPFRARLAVSLFPACATAPCNQRRVHQRVGIFPRSRGENVVTRRAQYGSTERGGEWMERCVFCEVPV